MKTDKEYPATHSMATAWYCVDEEGNVGVFDIDDQGPVPNGWYEELEVNELFWFHFSSDSEVGIKDLSLTSDQIKPLLMPLYVPDEWKQEKIVGTAYSANGGKTITEDIFICNYSWNNVIVKINMTKLPILLEAASMQKDGDVLVCLSRNEGYFFVDFSLNQGGVELLEKHKVVIARYKAPYYFYADWETDQEKILKQKDNNTRFPIFIYQQDYWPDMGAATRISNPAHPMKIEQLPEKIRTQITHLPVHFSESKSIQIAEYIPVYFDIAAEYNGEELWFKICSSHGEIEYYGEKTHTILTQKEMEKLFAEGKVKDKW